MLTTKSPTAVLPEGYIANERIGSGGYGEVWRATAPGGVDKAVKIIYGHCDDDLAERELKSMERIREVRHPFVISLERFEVIEGRLIIVTELADTSLDACFQKYQKSGEPGIPRDNLLAYLRDAAEALDFLVEQHSLQHLDVKPENMLLVGDHLKIGDFGLVKELATRTANSMMGGMTPVYSAPEVFDDDPSPRSDQYSLAIVYQQMLTGQLPFPGRTPAQLAKQHTQAEPMLRALSDDDQRVVGQALAKRPEHRFASCREFIKALSSAGQSTTATVATVDVLAGHVSSENEETKSSRSMLTERVNADSDEGSRLETDQDGVASAAAVKVVNLPAGGLVASDLFPTLVVGVGGLGIEMLHRIRSLDPSLLSDDAGCTPFRYLAIDTDREALRGESQGRRLDSSEYAHISLRRPKEYGELSPNMLRWVSRRWLYNIPRSLETRGYRPLGRIAIVDHARTVLESLYGKLFDLLREYPEAKKLRVVLLAGSGGGTGSGTVMDVAQAVNSLSQDLGIELVTDGVIGLPERAAGSAESLSIVNSYALLTELCHIQHHGNQSELTQSGAAARLEATTAPFRTVYLQSVPLRNNRAEHHEVLTSIAKQIYLEATTPSAADLFATVRGLNAGSEFRLQSVAVQEGAIGVSVQASTEQLARAIEYPYQRLTVAMSGDAAELQKIREQDSNLHIIQEKMRQDTGVSVAFGIEPSDVGRSLAKFFPDIAEAASRVHTRCDIEWQPVEQCEVQPPDMSEVAAMQDTPTLQKVASK